MFNVPIGIIRESRSYQTLRRYDSLSRGGLWQRHGARDTGRWMGDGPGIGRWEHWGLGEIGAGAGESQISCNHILGHFQQGQKMNKIKSLSYSVSKYAWSPQRFLNKQSPLLNRILFLWYQSSVLDLQSAGSSPNLTYTKISARDAIRIL